MKLVILKKQKRIRSSPPLAKYKLKELEAVISRTNILKARLKRMRFQSLGPKKDFINLKVRYGTAVSRGQPVCLSMNGTEDGFAVVLPSNSAAKAYALFYGVAVKDVASGAFGEAQVFGYCEYGMLARASRSATTVSWASGASIDTFAVLTIDTVMNAFASSGGTQAASAFLPVAVLLESVASYAGSASATSDTRTALTSSAKIFLRAM